jgi:hypothetical protein
MSEPFLPQEAIDHYLSSMLSTFRALERESILRINEQISFGKVKRIDGSLVEEPLVGGLINDQERRILPHYGYGLYCTHAETISMDQFSWL